MCQGCKMFEPHAAAIAEGPAHGIAATIMYLIAATVRSIGAQMMDSPIGRLVAQTDEEMAANLLTTQVHDEFCLQHYRMIRASPEPQFRQMMNSFVMTYFAAQAAADSEGRTPVEWFDEVFREQLEVMTPGFEDFRQIMDESYLQRSHVTEVEANDLMFLLDNGIDPDVLH